ncbi:MAG TPA: helix-turn-helix domain-containing protein, partial [Erysipelotrichaceae bacterium]|nr:helix-turn-helix domain-containing protein [Erysipelotrichaceae bacterium]
MPHLTDDDRKIISNMLSHKAKCCEIANRIGCDPTTISKEIKKNRIISKEARTKGNKILCKLLDRFPFVCLDCPKKYTTCVLTQLKYDAGVAQKKYEFRLHETRKGINLTKEEYDSLNHQLKEGLLNKRSVYEIVKTSKIDVSVP